MSEEAPQRDSELREVCNGMRWLGRTGASGRMRPPAWPPGSAIYQHMPRWLNAGVFETMTHELRTILRLAEGRTPDPSAMILESRTRQSTPESGARAGYAGAKRKRSSQVHLAVDTLGPLLAR